MSHPNITPISPSHHLTIITTSPSSPSHHHHHLNITPPHHLCQPYLPLPVRYTLCSNLLAQPATCVASTATILRSRTSTRTRRSACSRRRCSSSSPESTLRHRPRPTSSSPGTAASRCCAHWRSTEKRWSCSASTAWAGVSPTLYRPTARCSTTSGVASCARTTGSWASPSTDHRNFTTSSAAPRRADRHGRK